jgi:HrpA-like RNA helicase
MHLPRFPNAINTGCGKSTQVPQYLLRAGCERIAVTQPRRISAMSLTRRVALETNNEFGSEIAHQIRFDSSRTKHTRCVFLTEGVLLRQAMGDSTLHQYRACASLRARAFDAALTGNHL